MCTFIAYMCTSCACLFVYFLFDQLQIPGSIVPLTLVVAPLNLNFPFRTQDQRNLGMSMKIERSSLDQVKKRFDVNKRKVEEKKKEYDFEERLKELREEVSHEVWLVELRGRNLIVRAVMILWMLLSF